MTSLTSVDLKLKLSAWLAGREVSKEGSGSCLEQASGPIVFNSWENLVIGQLREIYREIQRCREPEDSVEEISLTFATGSKANLEDCLDNLECNASYRLLQNCVNVGYRILLARVNCLSQEILFSSTIIPETGKVHPFIKLSEDLSDALALCNSLKLASEKIANLEKQQAPGLTPVINTPAPPASKPSPAADSSVVLQDWATSAASRLDSALSDWVVKDSIKAQQAISACVQGGTRDNLEESSQGLKEQILSRYRELLRNTIDAITALTVSAAEVEQSSQTLADQPAAFKALADNLSELKNLILSCNYYPECATLTREF